MQQSHIQFLNLIDEDFLDSGFPEVTPTRSLSLSLTLSLSLSLTRTWVSTR